jgi:chromosome segregation ATPase
MKGLWILGGLAAAAVLLAVVLGGDSSADIERAWHDAVRERPTIATALEECGDLIRHFNEFKPTERKKGELEQLRRRFESLETTATNARSEEAIPREERKKRLARVEEEFWQLKRDAEDLRARLTEMKNFEVQLRPRIARLGELTQRLLAAQAGAAPEFQQRSGHLIEEGRRHRGLAETALQRLSVKIAEGRPLGMTALNELDEVLTNMQQLLDSRPAAPSGGGG